MTKELAATDFKTEGADGKKLKIYYGSMNVSQWQLHMDY